MMGAIPMKSYLSAQSALSAVSFVMISVLGLAACGVKGAARVKAFKEFSESSRELVQLELPNFQRALKAAQLPAAKITAYKQRLATETYTETQRTHLTISLGTLTREQCEVARKVYADGWKVNLSGIDCAKADGKKVFLLDDFLTPVMQATVRHTFIPEKDESTRELTAEERKQYGIISGGQVLISKTAETNCWSTAYEVLRRTSGQAPVYTIHNLLPEEVDLRLTDTKLTQTLKSKESASTLITQFKSSGVRFGDFIIVRDRAKADEVGSKSDIQHVTVLIDEGLVFERVGTDSVFPMRIATLNDVVTDYASAQFEVRRLLSDFPDPHKENFSLQVKQSSEGDLYDVTIELKNIVLSKSASGRYALPAN